VKSLIEGITLYQIIQGLITLVVICAWVYMLITGMEVSETLFNIVVLVVGFFFGNVGGAVANKASK
jgi:hypothetical protein